MLLRVAVDPEAPLDIGGRGPGPLLIRYLRDRCVLVFDSDVSRAHLARSLVELPAELRQVVLGLLDRRAETVPDTGPVPLQDLTEVAEVVTWAELADVLLLAEFRASALDEEGAALRPEYATFRDALHTSAFDNLADRWERHAPMGTSREELWNEVFAPFANRGPSVYITDGYAAKNLHAALSVGRRRHQTGPQWFLGHLARSKVRTVHLACSSDVIAAARVRPDDAHTVITKWFDGLGSGTRLHLHLRPGRFKHNRRIVFDGWAGFEIGNGMASFEFPSLKEEIELNASVALGACGRAEFQTLIAAVRTQARS